MDVDKKLELKVVRFLKQLGLSAEQAQIYIYLLTQGSQTVLQISRGVDTGRTKLYPLLEALAEQQVITIHERHYGTTYEAQPPQTLDFLVSEHERKASALRSNLPAAQELLSRLAVQSPTTTRTVEYRGIDGLKQMNFNLSKAKKEFRVFELAGLDKHLGKHFADRMRERYYLEQKLTSYDLTNNPKRTSEPGAEFPTAHTRYIDPSVFAIEFETYIYDSCTALISYDSGDIFGIEIYSNKLARQQRQVFDLLWRQAEY